jgi:hypothetical protein
MRWRSAATIIGIVGTAAVIAAEAAHAQDSATKLLAGDAKVEVVASYQGDALPKPDQIMICDFDVPADVVTMDQSATARLQRRRLQRRDADADSSPQALAMQVQSAFARTLTSELQKLDIPAETAPADDVAIPPRILIVHGEFTSINQGNKTKRMIIGFGRGASDVKAHVTVSLTTDAQPVLLSEFNLKSQSGKKPGAAATMGVGSVAVGAAAGGMGDRKASVEADTSRMAKAVAQQIKEAMISQKWIAAQQPEAP